MKVTPATGGAVWIEIEVGPRGYIVTDAPEGAAVHLCIDDPRKLVTLLEDALDQPRDGDVWSIFDSLWGYSADRGGFIPLDTPVDGTTYLWSDVRALRAKGEAKPVGMNLKDVW